MVEFLLLGPIEVRAAGALVDAGPPRQRCVLAALAADAGRPVSVGTLVDRVWGLDPPQRVRHALYVYITRIRKLIGQSVPGVDGPVAVVRRSSGYVLDVEAGRVDMHMFRQLTAEARDPACRDARRVALLGQALELWRGAPLADLPGDWADRVRQVWQQEYLGVVTAWAHAALHTGNAAVAVGTVSELVEQYPLNEALTATLMRILHAGGRNADALDTYARARSRLVEELGTDPAAELQALYRQILRGEPTPARAAPGQAADSRIIPALLPADLACFVGRIDHLTHLDGLLTRDTATVVISAIAGTAGVGKTALAVRWAHSVRHRFPDGQLYINLRGFESTGSVMSPAEAIRRFLDALQVPPGCIPPGLDAQIDLYRSLLADKRMLIVVDNARDTVQVRPLLPGAPTCMVVVTSRNQLCGLVAAEGAFPINLDLLSVLEAEELLRGRLGHDRVAPEPAAVGEIITYCARLPLALIIVAARAAIHPRLPLTALAGELRETRDRLDVLAGDDPHTDVRVVFSWSYRTLTPDAARLFRLLGLHPGPDISVAAAASLIGLPLVRVRPLLAELTRTNLLVEHSPGRYTFHDLLRVYATDLAHSTDTGEEHRAATHRVLDHYLHTAHAATRLLRSCWDPIALAPTQPGTITEHQAGHHQALAWLTTEHAVLIAAVDHAAAAGFDTQTWQLAWTLDDFLDRRGHWHEQAATAHVAAAAADRLADPTAQAHTQRLLANAYLQLGQFDRAHTHLDNALNVCLEASDPAGEARIHINSALAWERQGRHTDALDEAQRALDLFQAAGHRPGQANALNNVGWMHAQLGEYRQALAACHQALTLYQELGNRHGQAATWDSIGYAHHHLGNHAQAIACYQESLDLFQQLDDRYYKAGTLTHLGDIYHVTSNPRAAQEAWHQALIVLVDLNHPDAEHIRTKLAALDTKATTDRPGPPNGPGIEQPRPPTPTPTPTVQGAPQ